MALPVALGIVAPVAGRLADRLGVERLAVGGMAVVVTALVTLAAVRPSTAAFVGLLAAVGAGLGCFTPPNNASIMASAPAGQSGVASGVLNMTRGMGTALGLAVTGLVFDLSGGTSSVPSDVADAFAVSAVVLAGVALVAAVVAAVGAAVARRTAGVPGAVDGVAGRTDRLGGMPVPDEGGR